MKILVIGDMHVTPSELGECSKLIDLIYDVIWEHKPELTVFLGDQYHTHAIVHLNVLQFWLSAFDKIRAQSGVTARVALVGNHDKAGDRSATAHAMMPHMDQINVVETIGALDDNIVAASYVHSPQEFVENINRFLKENPEVTPGLLICHQTFSGAEFDSGFFPDGIDPNALPFKQIISGHIHKQQEFGKVWYPGSPRWRTISDANQKRAIWLVNLDCEGTILDKTPIDTSVICKPIYVLEDTPESPVTELPKNATTVIDVRGPADYVEKRKTALAEKGVRVRCFPTSGRKIEVKESDGITIAFNKFTEAYKPLYGTDVAVLKKLCQERLSWTRPLN